MDYARNYMEEYSTDVMTGGRNERMQLYYQLVQSLQKAESVDIIVSFLMESGVKLLLDELENALQRKNSNFDGQLSWDYTTICIIFD